MYLHTHPCVPGPFSVADSAVLEQRLIASLYKLPRQDEVVAVNISCPGAYSRVNSHCAVDSRSNG